MHSPPHTTNREMNSPIEERIYHEAPDGILLMVLERAKSMHALRLACKSLLAHSDFCCKRLEWVEPAVGHEEALSFLTDLRLKSRFPNVQQLHVQGLPDEHINLSSISLITSGQLLCISFYNCFVTDLSSLSACRNLQRLDISKTRVVDFSPLSDCTNLRHLEAMGCYEWLGPDCLDCLINLPLDHLAISRGHENFHRFISIWKATDERLVRYLACDNLGFQILASMVLGAFCHDTSISLTVDENDQEEEGEQNIEEMTRIVASSIDLGLIYERMQPGQKSYDLQQASAFLLYSLTLNVPVGSLVALSHGSIFSSLVQIIRDEEGNKCDPFDAVMYNFDDMFFPFVVEFGLRDSAMGLLSNLAFEDVNKLRIYQTPGAFDLILHYTVLSSDVTQARATLALANLADNDELNPIIASVPGIYGHLLTILGDMSKKRMVHACTALALANLTDGDDQKIAVGKIEGVVPQLVQYINNFTRPLVYDMHGLEALEWVLTALGNLMDHDFNRERLQVEFIKGMNSIGRLIDSNSSPDRVKQKALVCLCKGATAGRSAGRWLKLRVHMVTLVKPRSILVGLLSSSLGIGGDVSDQVLACEALSCLTSFIAVSRWVDGRVIGTQDVQYDKLTRQIIKALKKDDTIPHLLRNMVNQGQSARARDLASRVLERLSST